MQMQETVRGGWASEAVIRGHGLASGHTMGQAEACVCPPLTLRPPSRPPPLSPPSLPPSAIDRPKPLAAAPSPVHVTSGLVTSPPSRPKSTSTCSIENGPEAFHAECGQLFGAQLDGRNLVKPERREGSQNKRLRMWQGGHVSPPRPASLGKGGVGVPSVG